MRIRNIVWAIAAISFAMPVQAQEWDMVQSTQVAPELSQTQYQSPINPASLGGYSVSNTGGTVSSTGTAQTALNSGGAPVFGTSNDGYTSPGGYVPPMINIPGLGSYRIPTNLGIPGVSLTQ
jgi:hypothetical protein